jgi:hypothetical protein
MSAPTGDAYELYGVRIIKKQPFLKKNWLHLISSKFFNWYDEFSMKFAN